MSGPAEPVAAATPPPPRRRRGLWIALIASLAVNVFLVGWVASSWVYGPRFAPGMRVAGTTSPFSFQHRSALRALSGSEREAVERVWREGMGDLRERGRALRQARMDMRTAFAADQADAKSLGDAVAAFKDKANAMFDHANATLLKIATMLPPESRKAYFNAGFPRPRGRDRERRSERENR
jgi:uncharacterized membrane protein